MVIRRFLRKLATHLVIKGYDEFCARRSGGRALLSYLAFPLLPPSAFRDRVKFSNRGIAQGIARALNELGYIVDIVNYDNRSWRPRRDYDIFVGHGGINYARLSTLLSKSTARVYFSTGIHWKEWNARLARRSYHATLRTGFVIPSRRYIENEEDSATEMAHGIICLGNKNATVTYSGFGKVIGINNGVFPVNWAGWRDKDYEAGRKKFLFFSGGGNLLKGLDLVVESFVGTDLELHICQRIDPEFCQAYGETLRRCGNIQLHGVIGMRSREFQNLVRLCNWVISATCAEGQPGALLECMAHGLIPIAPGAANIDLEDIGIVLGDCDTEAIRKEVVKASEMKAKDCAAGSAKVARVVEQSFSPEAFVRNFKSGVIDILASRPGAMGA